MDPSFRAQRSSITFLSAARHNTSATRRSTATWPSATTSGTRTGGAPSAVRGTGATTMSRQVTLMKIFSGNERPIQSRAKERSLSCERKFCLVAPGWCLAKQDLFSAQACTLIRFATFQLGAGSATSSFLVIGSTLAVLTILASLSPFT